MRLDDFVKNTAKLPRDTEIKVYCRDQGKFFSVDDVVYMTASNTIHMIIEVADEDD